ncbi:hypothetical protein OROHE_010759 [Orobanche hederae]
MLAKKGLPNAEDLERLFAGRTATGEREFSTAMARSKVMNDLFGEGEGEGEGEEDGERGVDSEDELDQNVNSHSDVMDQNVIRAALILGLEELRKRLTIPSIESRQIRRPLRTGGESGSQYIHRLLNAHPDLFKEQLRLHSGMFIKLVDLMIARKLLSDGRFVKVAEQVGICIFILAKGASYRDAADVFKHSLSTICKYFKKVLEALVTLSFDIVRPHADLSLDCAGALDGTHIQAVISDSEVYHFEDERAQKLGMFWLVALLIGFSLSLMWDGKEENTTWWTLDILIPLVISLQLRIPM